MLHTPTTVLAFGVMLAAGGVAAHEPDAPSRVRSEHATITRLIAQATRQSTTFRREIEAINVTDGLVYVHDAPCGGGVRACLVHTVELAWAVQAAAREARPAALGARNDGRTWS